MRQIINRFTERTTSINLHRHLLFGIRRACGQVALPKTLYFSGSANSYQHDVEAPTLGEIMGGRFSSDVPATEETSADVGVGSTDKAGTRRFSGTGSGYGIHTPAAMELGAVGNLTHVEEGEEGSVTVVNPLPLGMFEASCKRDGASASNRGNMAATNAGVKLSDQGQQSKSDMLVTDPDSDTNDAAGLEEGSRMNNNACVEPDDRRISKRRAIRHASNWRMLEEKIAASESLVKSFTKLLHNLDNCWIVYDAKLEFTRMGIPNTRWRLTSINDNYESSPTYPAVLAVPQAISDAQLKSVIEFRSKGRFPVLSWIHATNRCIITRAAQPLVGLNNKRCTEDELLLTEINACGPSSLRLQYLYSTAQQQQVQHQQPYLSNQQQQPNPIKPFVIVDARPLLNAKANQAAGKGVESEKVYDNCSVLFLDIANIHAMRKSWEGMEDACNDESNWHNAVQASGWLGHIRRVLLGVAKIIHLITHEQISVLVHCSDGWDRTAQLTSLSMMLMDSYYRTIFGFIVLIEKEWISFGHKFADRLGFTNDGWKDEERSPIFAQFLDCVHQCLIQHPDAFEFTEDLLIFIMQYMQSGWFSNFLYNTEREMKYHMREQSVLSIWAVVLGNKEEFINPTYAPADVPIMPVLSRSRIVVWSGWFLRWQDRLWGMSWESTNHLDIKKVAESGAWVDKADINSCTNCQRNFSFFRRKHHCRCCGQIFCAACSQFQRIVATISTSRTSRCCGECAALLDASVLDFTRSSNLSRRTKTSSAAIFVNQDESARDAFDTQIDSQYFDVND